MIKVKQSILTILKSGTPLLVSLKLTLPCPKKFHFQKRWRTILISDLFLYSRNVPVPMFSFESSGISDFSTSASGVK